MAVPKPNGAKFNRLGFVAARVLLFGGIAGLLGAAATLPLAGRSLVWARTSTSPLGSVPAVLIDPVVPQRSQLLDADGSLLAQFFNQDRVVVPLSSVSPIAQKAVIAAEDVRFYHHGGIDLFGMARAAIADLASGGKPKQGGSSITQQYVRQVLALVAPTEAKREAVLRDSLTRKLNEARLAVALEGVLPKNEILQGYLNVVYFGEGAYGIEAAAERFFGTSASKLTLPQAAVLAGTIRDPSGLDPLVHPDAALVRRNQVLDAMAKAGFISKPRTGSARAAPLGLDPLAPLNGCVASQAPFFCDFAYRSLLQEPALGATVTDRSQELLNGGLTVTTTVDPKAQASAQAAVNQAVPSGGTVGSAVDIVVPGTGAVAAMAVDRRYTPGPDGTEVNLATGGATGYPAGSTFKLFTLAAALEQGVPLNLTLYAPPSYVATGFRNCSTGKTFPPYLVHNAEAAEGGIFNLPQATWESVNTYYLQLEQRTGLCLPSQIAASLGVQKVEGGPLDPVPSFTLGSEGVSPLAMSAAYAAMAAHGLYCPVFAISSIQQPGGIQLSVQPHPCHQAVPPSITDAVTGILTGVIDGPDPNRTGAAASIGRPAAGKTGTTEAFSAAWFCGYTPQLAGCAWVGDPSGGFAHPLANVTIAGRYYPKVFGASIPAPMWANAISGALAGVSAAPLPGD